MIKMMQGHALTILSGMPRDALLQDICGMMKLSAAESKPLDVSGESEFLQVVNGRDSAQVWAIMDDLMDTVRVTAPRAYKSVMERIRAIQ